MSNINDIGRDAETLYSAIQRLRDKPNLVSNLESELKWEHERLPVAAQELMAQGRIRAVLINYDGGGRAVDAIEP